MQQLVVALLLQHVEASLQDALQRAFLHAGEVIGLAAAGGMQSVADSEIDLGRVGIEHDLAKVVEAPRLRDPGGDAQLLQDALAHSNRSVCAWSRRRRALSRSVPGKG